MNTVKKDVTEKRPPGVMPAHIEAARLEVHNAQRKLFAMLAEDVGAGQYTAEVAARYAKVP